MKILKNQPNKSKNRINIHLKHTNCSVLTHREEIVILRIERQTVAGGAGEERVLLRRSSQLARTWINGKLINGKKTSNTLTKFYIILLIVTSATSRNCTHTHTHTHYKFRFAS